MTRHVLDTAAGELRIRPASSADAGAVFALREELTVWLIGRGIAQWRQGDLSVDWLELCIAHGWIHVFEREDALVATATVAWSDPLVWGDSSEPAGYIHMLMVDRRFAGQGVGRAVLDWGEYHIADSGRELARLDCVRTNVSMLAYYERAGYRIVRYNDFAGIEGAHQAALCEKRL